MTEQNKKIIELMKKLDITDEKELQEFLKKKYYSDVPAITDEEYDELFGDKDYVGYTPEQNGPWEVLPHKIAMGSLPKLKTWEQAQQWIKDNGPVIWEPKLDGLSIELVYEYGTLVHAILRGGGDAGEDILKNAKNFIGVLPSIKTKYNYVSVRGEVIISQTNFNKLCELSKEAYANRRNCISGICRRYDGLYSDLLGFYAYDLIEQNDDIAEDYQSEVDILTRLYGYQFKIPFAYDTMTEDKYAHYGDIRDTAEEFQMDGLVLKVLNRSAQIALKFEPKGEQTRVTHYTWDIGTTGKLVPIIWFEPVTVGGTRLTKAAIGSYQGYLDLNATVGSTVEVRKMNDVIPKVTKVVEQSTAPLYVLPNCPICGEPLDRQGADLYCINKTCPVKIKQKICSVYWAIAFKGVTSGWIEKLIEEGQFKEPADLLKATAEDIVSVGGFSLNRAEWIISEMHTRWKDIIINDKPNVLLWMIPIPTISGKSSEKLASIFSTVQELKSWISEFNIDRRAQLVALLGNAKGNKAYNYFSDNKDELVRLVQGLEELASEQH